MAGPPSPQRLELFYGGLLAAAVVASLLGWLLTGRATSGVFNAGGFGFVVAVSTLVLDRLRLLPGGRALSRSQRAGIASCLVAGALVFLAAGLLGLLRIISVGTFFLVTAFLPVVAAMWSATLVLKKVEPTDRSRES